MSTITIIICVLTAVLFKTGICISYGNTASEKVLNLGDSQKVVNNTAKKGQFPYVAHLLIIANTTTQVCTGTIVAKSYVVTSAYCFSWDFLSGTAQRVIVDAGNVDGFIEWNPLSTEQTVVSTSWWVHPAYNFTTKENDIAIITLSGAFWWTSAVSALALPSSSATFDEGTSCTVIGWGYGYGIASTLQYGSAKILSKDNCTVQLGTKYSRDSVICTTSTTAAPCLGDYGGPLVCTGTARDGTTGLVLAGIMTGVDPNSCSVGWTTLSGNAHANTRVSSFTDTINAKTGGTSTTSPRFLFGIFMAFICAIKLLPA